MSSYRFNSAYTLPENYIIPEDENERNYRLREYLNDISVATNSKDSGVYDQTETITGQQYIPIYPPEGSANAIYRGVLRMVVDFGALPNSTTKSVAHNIPNMNSDYSVTRIYGASTDPDTLYIPLPYASPTLANNIELYADNTNVNVVTGSNRTGFTRTFIVIEYITLI